MVRADPAISSPNARPSPVPAAAQRRAPRESASRNRENGTAAIPASGGMTALTPGRNFARRIVTAFLRWNWSTALSTHTSGFREILHNVKSTLFPPPPPQGVPDPVGCDRPQDRPRHQDRQGGLPCGGKRPGQDEHRERGEGGADVLEKAEQEHRRAAVPRYEE